MGIGRIEYLKLPDSPVNLIQEDKIGVPVYEKMRHSSTPWEK